MKPLAPVILSFLLVACEVVDRPSSVGRIEAAGAWQHADSRFVFPDRLGCFERVEINQFDREGKLPSVGVGYNYEDATAAVVFTVYVGSSLEPMSGGSASLQAQFEFEKDVIRQHHGSSESSSSPLAFVVNGRRMPGFAAEFRYADEFAQERRPFVSQLFLFEDSGWFIKYRVTFAAIQEATARPVVEVLLRSAPWGGPAEMGGPADGRGS